jgi:DNA-binding MarR family transcriptional regulator
MADPVAFRVMNEIGIIDQLGTTLFERSMPHGLTLPQFIVLNHFVRLGGERTPLALAQAIQVTKATMTSTLQRLLVKGFISSVPDATDGRSKRITITQEGRAAREDAIQAIAQHLSDMERVVGIEDMQAALPFLIKLRSFLDTQRSESSA